MPQFVCVTHKVDTKKNGGYLRHVFNKTLLNTSLHWKTKQNHSPNDVKIDFVSLWAQKMQQTLIC